MVEFNIQLDFKTVDLKKAFSSKFLLTNETALPHFGYSMILRYFSSEDSFPDFNLIREVGWYDLTKYMSRPHVWPIMLSI